MVNNYKQMIVLRTDINMSIGKMISQACHACLESAEITKKKNRNDWENWRKEGAKKIVLKVNSLKDILMLEKKTKTEDLPCYLVEDKGLTELPPGTITALAIGPTVNGAVDRITGHLKLLSYFPQSVKLKILKTQE